ncbi:hypothetical protein DH2020_006464 [Rehmannia glutinosa]|uniref:Casein kinase substrate phosphoprotein PP28 domain-containing protein n=1 Tax=Rehmannia glutinosa TaxID=99300 RepID=A0ABR0XIX1_REHGL
MGRGKFKGKPTGRCHFSTPEEMLVVPLLDLALSRKKKKRGGRRDRKQSSSQDVKERRLKKLGAHERYMRLQEQGKTDQAKKDLERLALIRQQRAEAAKKREEEKAAKEQKKVEARK